MSSFFVLMLILCLFWGWHSFQTLLYRQKKQVSGNDRKRAVSMPMGDHVGSDRITQPASNIHSIENYTRLYHQLHHVDDHPEVLRAAERLLQSLLFHTDRLASTDKTSKSIFHITEYTEPGLLRYMLELETSVQDEFREYCENRKIDRKRDIFETKEEAATWLKSISPVKLVDGAWLGNIRVASAPFALQPILRTAWQVLSEELGDGVLAQNHVHVFENLLRSVIPDFPKADSLEFIELLRHPGNARAWRSALAQLTISLFPDRYVPEILGFNMNFELMTLETLKASTELKEIGLDPLYFLLHICIDNSDVGHTAMAVNTVVRYVKYVRDNEGDVAADEAWRKVQRGFALSQYVGQIADEDLNRHNHNPDPLTHTCLESQVIEIFRKKTQPARSVHCTSLVKLRGLSLEEWLAPDRWESPEWRAQFIDALVNTKPWIVKGMRSRSRLMRELAWGGKMFGAFTAEEYEVVGQWIDQLEPDSHPEGALLMTSMVEPLPSWENPVSVGGKEPVLDRLLPLWFSSVGLLEGFCAIPAHTTSHFAMHILSTLRSQSGLGQTGYGIADTTGVPKGLPLSLGAIGQEMVDKAGLPLPKSIYDMLEWWPVDFGWTMMNLARSSSRHGDYLLGMALAFASLHEAMATSQLLCTASQFALLATARSELFHLGHCKSMLRVDQKRKLRFDHGYRIARAEIEKAFIVTGDDTHMRS